MVNTDVIDTLEDIKKWAKAYKLLEIIEDTDCKEYICCECRFNSICNEISNLVK